MDRTRCLKVIELSAEGIADVARDAPHAEVPPYPGSDVSRLVRHVITIHEWVTGIVSDLADGPRPQAPPDAGLKGDALLARFDASWRALVAALEAADDSAPVWTFGIDKVVRFWVARMAHETAMHRWDVDSAVTDDPDPIPRDVAVSGLREGLHVHCFRPLRKTEVGGSGEQIVVSCTDAPEAWTVALQPVGIVVEQGESAAAVAGLTGTASDLWLAMARRLPFDRLRTSGDQTALDRFEQALATIPAAL